MDSSRPVPPRLTSKQNKNSNMETDVPYFDYFFSIFAVA